MAKKQWFYGKNILLTGVSSGIGFYMAKLFASKYDCNIFGIGRNLEKLENAKKEIDKEIEFGFLKKKNKKNRGSFEYVSMDISSFEKWNELKILLDEKGFKVDVLINNAGIMLPFDRFENQSIEDVKRVFETNLFAHMYSYKTFLEDLKKAKGAIINISSSSALCSVAGEAIYGASKSADKSFTESISIEHKKDIYIAYVCPGFTSTDLFRGENEMSKLVKSVCMPAQKMAKKIVKSIARKKKRIVLGIDAHFMSGLNRIAPRTASNTISEVLRISKDSMFDKVYPENVVKKQSKKR